MHLDLWLLPDLIVTQGINRMEYEEDLPEGVLTISLLRHQVATSLVICDAYLFLSSYFPEYFLTPLPCPSVCAHLPCAEREEDYLGRVTGTGVNIGPVGFWLTNRPFLIYLYFSALMTHDDSAQLPAVTDSPLLACV